ncbi:CU044_2847 family protein [Streptomyces sp. NPDC093546]|uniref:CU044_2847 family protein n=1 Tax=Streptomyces sp. NPDC093546 TaxID=3366040 RepID=UPI0037FC1406
MSQPVRLEMPDGQVIWATVAEEGGPSDSGIGERLVERLEGFQQSLRAVAVNTRAAVAGAMPDEVTVEFGLELAAGQDGVVAAVVGGSGKAAFKITLKWNGPGAMVPAPPAVPAQPPVPPQPSRPPTATPASTPATAPASPPAASQD